MYKEYLYTKTCPHVEAFPVVSVFREKCSPNSFTIPARFWGFDVSAPSGLGSHGFLPSIAKPTTINRIDITPDSSRERSYPVFRVLYIITQHYSHNEDGSFLLIGLQSHIHYFNEANNYS